MADDKHRQLFLSLVYSFQMQGMMQLGKLTNPVTNTTERELNAAQVTIDMLDMLKAKSKGNIGDDESKFLDQVIADLKLNFVEEKDKAEKENSAGTDSKDEAKSEDNNSEAKHKPVTEEAKDADTHVPPQE